MGTVVEKTPAISQKEWRKLETISNNIMRTYHNLHQDVKQHSYEAILVQSLRFAKEVMHYINELRHFCNNVAHNSTYQVQEKAQFLNCIEEYIKNLKTLSLSYKRNENFMHTRFRFIVEDEETRLIKLEQAIQSVKGLLQIH
ncbi:MAG TPA: hypothetical protein VFP93_00815 [Gammaproteobacteria bacterium]|nr:hypothetical protein [Gammaproteobacteria bacterium]